MKYEQIYDGNVQEFDPKKEILVRSCCDCGLVHEYDYEVTEKGTIKIKTTRNKRRTGQVRRHLKVELKSKEEKM